MNKTLLGFFLGICFMFSLGAVRVSQKYSDPIQIEREFLNVYEYLQDKKFRVETTTPTINLLRESEPFFVNNKGLRYCVKIGTVIYSVDMKMN